MKRILITLIIVVVSLIGFSQPFTNISDGDAGSSVRSTLNAQIDYLNDLGYDLEFSADATNWHYGWQSGDLYIRYSDDFGSTWSDAVFLWDGEGLNYFTTDTLVLGTDTITSFAGAGANGLEWNSSTNYLKLLNDATAVDSVLIEISSKPVYTITLPSATSVANRVSGAVEGTDYPIGWVISDGTISAADLDITHTIGRRVISVDVFYNYTGTVYRQLVNFSNAYTGIVTPSDGTLRIEGLTTVQKEIKIYITFAQ